MSYYRAHTLIGMLRIAGAESVRRHTSFAPTLATTTTCGWLHDLQRDPGHIGANHGLRDAIRTDRQKIPE